MLSFFKKEVIFKFQNNHDWTIVQFYTPLETWKEMLKNAICSLCADNLYFDDYIIGHSNKYVEINIHADLSDSIYDFLINRHGFNQGHQNKDQNLSDWLNNDTYFIKKMTERQLVSFCKDVEKMHILPSEEELSKSNPGVFEHLKPFDSF